MKYVPHKFKVRTQGDNDLPLLKTFSNGDGNVCGFQGIYALMEARSHSRDEASGIYMAELFPPQVVNDNQGKFGESDLQGAGISLVLRLNSVNLGGETFSGINCTAIVPRSPSCQH